MTLTFREPEPTNHHERVAAIQRDLFALKMLTSAHAESVNEKVSRIQARLDELSTANQPPRADTMESDV